MKIIREHIILEKFVEGSDPVKDLSIGIYVHRKFEDIKEMYEWLSENLPVIIGTDNIPKNILSDPHPSGFMIHHKYVYKLVNYVKKYIKYNDGRRYTNQLYVGDFAHFLEEKYPDLEKWYEHILFEKFTQDSDPIDDLQIGMMHQIKRWVETKISYKPNEKDLLWICAQCGKTEFVKYLLEKGANVHADHDLALRWASENGHTEVVKLLLDAGADVHANDDYALRWASENGHTEVVKLLIDAGADVHADDYYALRWASYNGHTEVVKLLLDAGADVHANDDYALRGASYNGHTEVVKLLIDAGADVHADDDWALRWASENGHAEVVKVLKDHIAKEKNKNKIKENLNEKFAQDSDPIDDLHIGIQNQLEKWVKNKMGLHYKDLYSIPSSSILYLCITYNKYDFVQYLLENGTVPELHHIVHAQEIENEKMYRLLVKYYMQYNSK